MINKLYTKISKKLRAEYGAMFRKFVLNDLIFFVTYQCNLRCGSCFYAGSMEKGSDPSLPELTLEEIHQISLSLGPLENLFICGGEPFLRDDLRDICWQFYSNNKIKSIHLPTNGSFTKKILEQTHHLLSTCPGIKLTLSLPLDGLRETHDRIKGTEGSFDNVIETVTALAHLKYEFDNLTLYIITTVNNRNVHETVKLAEFVKNTLPVDGHGPSPLRGIPHDKALSPPSSKEWKELAARLIPYHQYWNQKAEKKWIDSFIGTNRTRYLYNIYSDVLAGRGLPFKCQAGNTIGVLEPNGEVKLCELTESVGNVRNFGYDFKKVWRSDIAKEMRKQTEACSCTNACFLWPSIDLSWPAYVKSSFF